MNLCIGGLVIPARSYPTDMLKMVSKGTVLSNPRTRLKMWISTQALMYSQADWSSLSSWDHSTLYPSSSMSMQGRGISSSSRTWTVLSSMNLPPQSQADTMFWVSWVWGPAAGPIGVPRRCPRKF